VKKLTAIALISFAVASCNFNKSDNSSNGLPIVGTWKLLKGTLQEKGVTNVTDYTKNTSFIKIINDTHFAFLQHTRKSHEGNCIHRRRN